ncbi:MAG: nitroreductase family protein [Armatimonadetes bacterium]|jgi:nitroreductase|nr:nitroreductase family protein [Armatimonadota bacterium]MDI9602268.1 nitroreductase family protein [Acidobacteriota bacterium]
MHKVARTVAPIHRLLAERWSPRAFRPDPVAPEALVGLLEAARWAPSAGNMQPWYFIVATQEQPEEFEKLLSCLVEGNRRWCGTVPVLMLTVARVQDTGGDENRWATHDVGLAAMSLTIQAASLGLYCHQMAGVRRQHAAQLYQVPAGHEVWTAIAVGYRGDPESLPDDLMERELAPRTRKPLDSFVFSGSWGETPAWLPEAP